MDPSMNHWGMCKGYLDLADGTLDVVSFKLIEPEVTTAKVVRKNSKDIDRSTYLYKEVREYIQGSDLLFAEVPVGSQSSRAQTGYGICVAILGSLIANTYSIIQVDPSSNKIALVGKKTASKSEMIKAAIDFYPNAPWLRSGTRIINKNEHLADAIGAIHAGVQTPEFNNYLAVYKSLGKNHAN